MLDCLPFELRRHWEDPAVTDVLVNDETEVWVERRGRLERSPDLRPGEIDVTLQRLLAPLGRRLDRLAPMVDARLPDGTRVCAVIEPVAVGGTCAAFRIFRQTPFSLEDFAPSDSERSWVCLEELIRTSTANILITGATGSGKSALLGSLASMSSPSERLIVIEDTYELVIEHPNVVRLESRNPTHEGRGAIGIDDLLRTALRLRPDRLIVGEVRGREALTLVQAMSTGHRRCLATLHANSALDGLHRLDVLILSAAVGWTIEDARSLVDSAIGLAVHMERSADGRRVVDHVAAVDPVTHERYGVTGLRP
ncbi:MAG: CpaF family protein [Actinomycetota bacterium]